MRRFDDKKIYCRLLGHEIGFAYCRRPVNGLLCSGIISCWKGRFDIENYLSEVFSEKELKAISRQREDKMPSLVNLIKASMDK